MLKSTAPLDGSDTNNAPRLLWIGIGLFFAIYLALIIVLISYNGLWRATQPYAELIIQHPSLIRFSTCILCSGCAWFLFWPREGSRFIGRWSDYVGLAFATFAVQYGLRFVELKLEGSVSPTTQSVFHHTASSIVYLCSALNNLLFFAAARILLNKNKARRIYLLKEDDRVFFQLKKKLLNGIAEFRGAVPGWAWIWAALGPLALLDSWPRFFWARFPDAIFSVYCLSWFGYAVAVNLNIRRHKLLAATAMLIALTYGGAQLVYATNPIIAYSAFAKTTRSLPVNWIRTKIGTKANDLAVQTNKQTGRSDNTNTFLDNAVYAVLLPMKLALFLPAFSLYLLFFIVSLNDLRPALFDSISRRKDYLSSDGIVSAIAKAIGAEKVSLYIRIPGLQELPTGQEERALPLVWHNPNGDHREKPEPVSIKNHAFLQRIMNEEGREILNSNQGPRATTIHETGDERPWFVPIKFHGGVIGALQADLVGDRKNHITLQKFRLMADLIAPSVQDYRSLAAMDQMGFRFTRLQVDYPKDSFTDSTGRMAAVMHDVLSPLASGLIIEIGFKSIHHFEGDSEKDKELLKDQEDNSWLEDEETELIGQGDSIRLEKSKMVVRSRQKNRQGAVHLESLQIGGLMFTIPAERDEFSRPTLAAYGLNRKAVASLVADGVFDLARDSLGEIIKELGVEFNKEPLSAHTWFATVDQAIRRSGILWAVACAVEKGLHGAQQQSIEIDSELTEADKESLFTQSLRTPGASDLSAKHIVKLALPKSKHRLWLGIERPGFGPELSFESPWRVFLSDLANVADAALDSVRTQEESELARQNQGVITIAVTTGTLIHQVLNMISDQLFTTEILEEETKKPGVQLNDRCNGLLQNLRTSALQGRELTKAFNSVTRIEGPWPCKLKDAAEEALKLYKMSLRQREIEATIDPSTEILVDVPFYVPAFTLANLIGNARDAIWSMGWIRIEAEEVDQFIECHVTNSGPEIQPHVQETLFEFGRSYNKEGHNGWGLYFVKRSLIENGGDIRLAHTSEDNTRFTIRLPKKHPTHESNSMPI